MNRQQTATSKKLCAISYLLGLYGTATPQGGVKIYTNDLSLLEGIKLMVETLPDGASCKADIGLKSRSTLRFKRKDGSVREYQPKPVFVLSLNKTEAAKLDRSGVALPR